MSILMHNRGGGPPQYVNTEKDAAALGENWSRSYVKQAYPCCLYNAKGETLMAKDAEEEERESKRGFSRAQVLPPPPPAVEAAKAGDTDRRLLELEVQALKLQIQQLQDRSQDDAAQPEEPAHAQTKAERLAVKQAEALARNRDSS